jgi:hypothetical protein
MLKPTFASAFLPFLTWGFVIALVYSRTGTFRIKPKEPKQKTAQVEEKTKGDSNSGSPGVQSSNSPSPAPSATVFLSLLRSAAELPKGQLVQAPETQEKKPAQEGLSVKSANMAFISVRTNEEPPQERAGAMIPCRLEAPLSNAKDGSSILIHGVVTDNIAGSSGKILIEAGTKVLGKGHIDALTGRIKSYGTWSLVSANHALRARARLQEYAGGRDGIPGQETSSEPQALQRQAIIRDGVYLYVPAEHDFTLELLGQFELRDLLPADD